MGAAWVGEIAPTGQNRGLGLADETGCYSGLLKKHTRAYPRFSEMLWGSHHFLCSPDAIVFQSWGLRTTSPMSLEDAILLISRVVFMQKRLEFILEITQLFES